MKKTSKIVSGILALVVIAVLAVAAAGMYKFNYLASLDGYDADGNKIEAVELEVTGDYVGMTVMQAQAQAKVRNVPFRVVKADGEVFAVTMDFRPGRINAEVEKGVVVSYTTEGE